MTGKRTDDRTMRDGVKRRCRPECPARACRNAAHTWAYVVTEPAPNGGRGRQLWRGGFAGERDAQAARRAALHQLDRGTYTRPTAETLGGVAPRWLASLAANGRKPSTLSAYDSDLRLYVLPALGGRPIAKVTAADVEALYSALVARGLAPRTVQRVAAVLGGLLGQAKRWRLIPTNPAADARVPRTQSARPGEAVPLDRATVWTEAQLARFLAHVADAPDGPLWTVAAGTGARRGELAALRWSDVDLDAGRVTIGRQAGRYRGLDGTWRTSEGTPKGGHARQVTLDAGTAAVLREHRRRQTADPLVSLAERRDGGGHVFLSPLGGPLSNYQIGRLFRRHVAALPDLPPIAAHRLRHTHATVLLSHGVPAATVAQRLGHSVDVCTRTYAHWLTSADEAAAAVWATAVPR